MALRTGIVALTLLVKGICHVLETYRTPINLVISTAVAGGVITADQRTVLMAWLDSTTAACDALRLISGY